MTHQAASAWLFVGAIASITTFGACASTPRGASPESIANASRLSPTGSVAFEEYCSSCHGHRGESVTNAPSILGVGALPEFPREHDINANPASGDPELLKLQAQTRPAGAPWRDPFRTAQDLYAYVSKNMPRPVDKAGSLTADQYWAIVNFMLFAQGVAVPPGGVTEGNASTVKL